MWDAYPKAAPVSVTPATPSIPHVHTPLQSAKSWDLDLGPKTLAGQCHGWRAPRGKGGSCGHDSFTLHRPDPGPLTLLLILTRW